MNETLRSNIYRRRHDELRRSQAQVARAMERLSGSKWSKQLVSRVETGGRRLDMNELVMMAEVLDTTVVELLRPQGSDVRLAKETVRSADAVFDRVAGDVAEMRRALEGIRERVDAVATPATIAVKASLPPPTVTGTSAEEEEQR
jgi:hypothetical protein